jgi:hypothetical protein
VTTFARLYKGVRSCWPEWTTLFLYAALVAFAIPYHEPWADEAQAWQLARSLSLRALFQTQIRYETSPGLWHLLLWVLIRAHVSYSGLHWICGVIATVASALLLLKSPFPRYLKLLLPFSYFLLFQYAVVARSYVLAPILLFSIALNWKKNPFILALLLGLLANLSLHTAVISGGLAFVYGLRSAQELGTGKNRSWRGHILSLLVLLAFYSFAIWTAWPPHDLAIPSSSGFHLLPLLWRLNLLCQPWTLSILFWAAIVICFHGRRALLYLLPVAFLAVFCVAGYANWWHVGLLFPLVLTQLWITCPTPDEKISRSEFVGRTAVIAMVGVQMLWSAYAFRFDHYHAFSPDLAASKFLQPFVQEGATIAVTYLNGTDCQAARAAGISPYFERSIFINQTDSYWFWSTRNSTEKVFKEVLPAHPAVVVAEFRSSNPNSSVDMTDPTVQLLDRVGYRFTQMFCGAWPVRLHLEEKSCHLIFQFVGNSQEPLKDNGRPVP